MENVKSKKALACQKLLRLRKLIDEGDKSGPEITLSVEAF